MRASGTTFSPKLRGLLLAFGVFVLLQPRHLIAQDLASLQFDQLSMADGLSAYPITSIIQDRQGFLWVGTVAGLNRYDGYGFTVYQHNAADSTSLSGNYVNVNGLAEDANGYIWVATRNGLNRYDPATGVFKRFYHDPDQETGLYSNVVMSLLSDEKGGMWIGTVAGLNKYDPVHQRIERWPMPGVISAVDVPFIIYDMQLDAAGTLWLAMHGGLFSLDSHTGATQHWNRKLEEDPMQPSGAHALLLDDEGDLWVGWSIGKVSRITPATDAMASFDLLGADRTLSILNFVLDIHRDDSGKLWVGLWDYGLVLLDPDTGSRQVYRQDIYKEGSLPGNRVSVVMRDRAGLMWIGTWDGLARIKPYQRFNHIGVQKEDHLKLSFPRATSVAVGNDGDLWIGTQGGGVNHLDASLNRIRVFRHDPNDAGSLGVDAVSSVLVDHEGMIWIGTEGAGLSRLDPGTGKMIHYRANPADTNGLGSNYIYKVIEDRNHRLWIGTANAGLNLFDRATGRFHQYVHDQSDATSLASNEVWTVFEDGQGTIWVGTINGGLHRVRFRDNTLRETASPELYFERFQLDSSDSTSLSSNNVVYINEDASGHLLIGTMGGGVNRLDKETGKFDSWSTADGLASDNIGCILVDDEGILWLSSSSGISRFDPESQNHASFSKADGLESAFFYFDGCIRGKDENLYFAGDEGVTFFDPHVIDENEVPPDVVLTNLEVHNKAVELDSLVFMKKVWRLNHDQNAITLRFAALDYTIPHQNAYKHKLEGIDQDWVQDGTTPFASYANLRPGHYTFKLLGANNAGYWSEKETVLDIIIRPAFYQTSWFKFVVGLLILSLVYGGFAYRESQRRRIEETRRRIADDLHDDLGSRLSGFALYFESLLRRKGLTEEDRKKIERYGFQSRMLVSDLRDMIWVIDGENDGLHALVDRIREVAFHMCTEANIEVHALPDLPDIKLPLGHRRNLVLIQKEVLNNAIRHAGATEIRIAIDLVGDHLKINVSDNGNGYDPASVVAGRGSKTIASRAKSMDAVLQIKTAVHEGTAVSIAVKIT